MLHVRGCLVAPERQGRLARLRSGRAAEVLAPQCASQLHDGLGRDVVHGAQLQVHVEVAHTREHGAAKPAFKIIAVRVQRHAIHVGAADRGPRIVRDEHLAVDEHLVQLESSALLLLTPECKQPEPRMIS